MIFPNVEGLETLDTSFSVASMESPTQYSKHKRVSQHINFSGGGRDNVH